MADLVAEQLKALTAEQLETLTTVLATGSLDRAATVLGISPSAVSQRISAMERVLGRRLIVRSRPARATEEGAVLARYAREVLHLTAAALRSLGEGAPEERPHLVLSIHPDALSTWVLAALAHTPGASYDLRAADGGAQTASLRNADVVAAVTSSTATPRGCQSVELGSLVYRPAAARSFADRWLADGLTDTARELAPRLRRAGAGRDDLHDGAPTTVLSPGIDLVTAVESGLGWAMVPEALIAARGLVAVPGGWTQTTPLHWQYWSVEAARLSDVAAAIRAGARRVLRGASDDR